MHYFSNNFSKITKRWGLSTKIELKNSVMPLFQWCRCYYITYIRHQSNVTRFFHFGHLPIKISGYASVK